MGDPIEMGARNTAEIKRSATEAEKLGPQRVVRSQIDRYINPCKDTKHRLEYAFFLLGNIENKTVLDLGCGRGENVVPLAERGANVIGIDISPHLIENARRRIEETGIRVVLKVGSAYDTGLPDESVDIIFCKALIHHLDIPSVRREMRRILRKSGQIIMLEPIRFSKTYNWFRSLLPDSGNISEFEHPLTLEEWAVMTEGFRLRETRYFRLPLVPLADRLLPGAIFSKLSFEVSDWMLRHWPRFEKFSTVIVTKLEMI